jgi:hypothetical protein
MRPEIQVILSGSLTFGVPLILAVRELYILRRGSGGGWRPDPKPDDVTPKPLPPCLLVHFERRPPVPEAPKPRVLELV